MSIKNLENDNQMLDDEIYQEDYYEDDELIEDDYDNYEDDIIDNNFDDDEDDEDDDDDDEYEEEYPRRKVKRKIKGLKLSFALIMIFIILGISAVLSISVIYLAKEYLGVDKSTTTYIVNIPEGSSTDEIIDILYNNNIIKVKELFKLSLKINADDDKPIVSGEHQISPSMDYGDIIQELQTSIEETKEVVTVTFPEGINVYDAGSRLQEAGVCNARDFIYYFNGGFDLSDYKFNSYLPVESTLKFLKLEGYLFPDTYEFYKDEDAEIVARKIFDNFDRKITDEYYNRMRELNMTLDEVITLASIIQKEAGGISEMKNISSVFHNRLNNPDTFPMLQSDPTRIYAEDVIHVHSDITNTTMENAYNTYTSAGLPPGAICNPGLDAIESALYPNDTNYFYFCADVNIGVTYYATTLEEHEANLEMVGITVE